MDALGVWTAGKEAEDWIETEGATTVGATMVGVANAVGTEGAAGRLVGRTCEWRGE